LRRCNFTFAVFSAASSRSKTRQFIRAPSSIMLCVARFWRHPPYNPVSARNSEVSRKRPWRAPMIPPRMLHQTICVKKFSACNFGESRSTPSCRLSSRRSSSDKRCRPAHSAASIDLKRGRASFRSEHGDRRHSRRKSHALFGDYWSRTLAELSHRMHIDCVTSPRVSRLRYRDSGRSNAVGYCPNSISPAIGSIPLLTSAARPRAKRGILISGLAASCSLESLGDPGENTVICCSFGRHRREVEPSNRFSSPDLLEAGSLAVPTHFADRGLPSSFWPVLHVVECRACEHLGL